jgi:deazaflavin-dependent oxidoreductase (nitroreductase family)
MTETSAYAPSPFERERTQVELYEATGGVEGGTLDDRPVIILTHTGIKSGLTRKSPLMRVEHDGQYALIASYGGAPEHPLWYHNVVANPVVEVQDGPVTHTMRAHEITGAEKEQWWQYAYATYPKFVEYRAKAPRDIPVLVVAPTDDK